MNTNVKPGRYVAIDIGTVTCRMLVADVTDDGHAQPILHPVVKEYSITNLGEGVDKTRRLSSKALRRVTDVIDDYLRILATLDTQQNPISGISVMATSASRDAENSDEFVTLLDARGLKLAVIPGKMETALSFAGASAAYVNERVAVVDVGGGSTEIAIGMGGEVPLCSHSFNIGCRRVTERFWDGYPPSVLAMEMARDWMRLQFEHWFAQDEVVASKASGRALFGSSEASRKPFRVIAVAGTATSAVTMRDRIEPYNSNLVDGVTVSIVELHELTQDLAPKTLTQLESVRGLDPKRAPVICAGMIILEEVMNAAGVASFTASESDILDGMIMYNSRNQE